VVPESRGTTTVVFFSGGGGLLLLMQPASMHAAIAKLMTTFILFYLLERPFKRDGHLISDDALLVSALRPGSGQSPENLSGVSYSLTLCPVCGNHPDEFRRQTGDPIYCFF
jgi:hypothetical protein